MKGTENAIPIIDVGALRGDAADTERVAREILAATADVGFFYVRNHGIDDGLIRRAVKASAEFFDFPLAVKQQAAVNQLNRGFMGVGECNLDGASHHCLKEVFFWGPQAVQTSTALDRPLVGANVWPQCLPSLQTEIWPYYEAVMNCGHRLLSAIAVAMGLRPDFFKSRYRHSLGRGQLLHYPQHPAEAFTDQFGAAPHTDFGCITLLWQDSSGGLEVRAPSGEWLAAKPIDDTLVVNIGDLLSRWSNNRLRSTLHRVRNLASHRRFSMAVFFDPDSDALIDPRDMSPGESVAALYPPITAGEYIMSRNRKAFAHFQQP
jgi:isopenicillin N synthase-like dioxygenase